MIVREAKALQTALVHVATDLKSEAVQDISSAMNTLLADMFALYVKTTSQVPTFATIIFCWISKANRSSPPQMQSPNVFERLAASPFTPSVACSACWTTTRITSPP